MTAPKTNLIPIKQAIRPDDVQIAQEKTVETMRLPEDKMPSSVQDDAVDTTPAFKVQPQAVTGIQAEIEEIKPLEAPTERKAPDFAAITKKAEEQAKARTEQAEADTKGLIEEQKKGVESIQTKLQEDTRKLQEKAEKETEERVARQEAIRGKIDQENLKMRSLEVKNITNTFSQQLANGKDSGFVNALNMNAVRSANKTYADSKLNLDLQFMQDTNNIYNKEFDTIFRLEEGLLGKITDLDINSLNYGLGLKESLSKFKDSVNAGADAVELNNIQKDIDFKLRADQEMWDEWNSSAKDFLDSLLTTGNTDEAIMFAEQASEISTHPYFKMMLNPALRNSLIENSNNQIMSQWGDNLNSINQIAINASTMGETMKAEGVEQMFNLMSQTPNQATRLMHNFFSNMTKDDLERYAISESDKAIVDDFLAGNRSWDDTSVKDVFSDSFIKDARREADEAEYKSIIESADIPSFIEQSPVGNEIVDDWLKSGMATENYFNVDIDTENIFGQAGISRIQFFGRQIDPSDLAQLGSLPGLDISFEGFSGDDGTEGMEPDIWTNQYKPKDAAGEKTIGGQIYENGKLVDSYLEYYKSFSERWAGSSAQDRIAMGEPLGKDKWAEELRLRNKNQRSDEKIDLNTFNNSLLKEKDVISTVRGTLTLPEDLKIMSDTNKERLSTVLGSKDAVNNLTPEDFANLAAQDGVVDFLRQQNSETDGSLFVDVSATGMIDPDELSRGILYTGGVGPFSESNLASTISRLDYSGDGIFEGNIIYGGQPRSIVVEPNRFHPSKDVDYWNPTASIKIIDPTGQTEPVSFQVKLNKEDMLVESKSSKSSASKNAKWALERFGKRSSGRKILEREKERMITTLKNRGS